MAMKSTNPLKSFRDARHITQQEFGAMIGVKSAMACHLENHRCLPSLVVFFEIHRVTGISLDALQKFFTEKHGSQNSNSRKRNRTKNRATR